MKRIGIFGGAFDPPHLGHLRIAETVLVKLNLDEIRFVPTNIPPHKSKSTATSLERLKMLEIALEDFSKFTIDRTEIDREGTSYTIDTIRALRNQEPESKFFFILGGDMIDYLPNWYKIDELMGLISFVGVNRPAYNGVTKYPIQMVEMDESMISSSLIRQRIGAGKAVDEFVPQKVLNFIKKNALYGYR